MVLRRLQRCPLFPPPTAEKSSGFPFKLVKTWEAATTLVGPVLSGQWVWLGLWGRAAAPMFRRMSHEKPIRSSMPPVSATP